MLARLRYTLIVVAAFGCLAATSLNHDSTSSAEPVASPRTTPPDPTVPPTSEVASPEPPVVAEAPPTTTGPPSTSPPVVVAQTPTQAISVDVGLWQRLHQCEQPDTWYADGYNSADPAHQRFQGGLGMSTGAWQMAVQAAAKRGVDLPGSALSSSIEQQMTGAQAFYEAYGWGWSCRV